MEEQKNMDPDQSQSTEFIEIETAQWQWQSNADPWKEEIQNDLSKQTWQDYSEDECIILEKAFLLNQELAELEEYQVNLKKMLQVSKKLPESLRKIRRLDPSRFMMDLAHPKIFTKENKTINEAFGTIQNFLRLTMQRTPEAYKLYNKLIELPLDCKEDEFADIIQGVVDCIEKGGERRERIIKTRPIGPLKSLDKGVKDIVEEIKGKSRDLKGFLTAILKAYTMNTFLYPWLNELLREEKWEELNVLTPYLVCLAYTFQLSEYTIKYQEPQKKGLLGSLFGYAPKQKLSLYRGTAFTREEIGHYDVRKVEYFSWNSVTSTSKSLLIAEDFLKRAIKRAKNLKVWKEPVIFIIEADFLTIEDREGIIDISQDSAYPKEEEVILAPGTAFKLLRVELTNKGVYEIYLKIAKQFTRNQNILRSISKDRAVLDDFDSQESQRISRLLEGNKLIRKIEIRNSVINEEVMNKIESIRATTNVKKEDVKLRNNKISVGSLSILAHYFSTESLNEIFVANKIEFFQENVRRANWEDESWKMKKLILDEKSLGKFLKTGQFDLFIEKIQDEEEQISSLNFSIKNLEISGGKFQDLLRCIRSFRSLEKINLKFNPKNLNSDRNIDLLCQAIKRHSDLKSLSLELSCSDHGLDRLRHALRGLTSLQYLHLDFVGSQGISNERLSSYLKNALEGLASLQYLSLGLKGHSAISDEDIETLMSPIKNMINLQHLALNFEGCEKISDKSLHHLKTALKPLESLRNLAVRLGGCKSISEQGIRDLKEVLIPSLTSLSLDLPFPDEAFSHLVGGGLKTLVNLQNLSLDLSEVSDEALYSLRNALTSLLSLQNLSLLFYDTGKISDKGLVDFQDALRSLTNLKHLSLDITVFKGSTDKWLIPLKNSLQPLIYLESLFLSLGGLFSGNSVEDKGLGSLRDALESLKSLKSLHLDLKGTSKITDQGIFCLADALKFLVSLENFSLNLRRCEKISGEGVGRLAQAIRLMKFLQYLSLDFGHCKRISLEGMKNIKNMLPYLGFLQHLSLDFTDCNEQYTIAAKSIFIDTVKYIPYFTVKGCGSVKSEENGDFERT